MNNKFKEGDIVYIREDIKSVCQNRYNEGMFTDTISEMYVFAGRKYKIMETYSRTTDTYVGGAYKLYDLKIGRYINYTWYDFHLIPGCECVDVNEVVNNAKI